MSTTREPPPILEMRNISKSFVGLRVLKNVSLNVRSGEVHALMGENGAGKSTLIKILVRRLSAPIQGEIRIDGEPVTIDGPPPAAAAGHRGHLPGAVARPEPHSRGEHLSRPRDVTQGIVDRQAMDGRAAGRILERLGVTFTPPTMVVRPFAGRAAAGRDRPRHPCQRPHPGHGRADRGALRARDRSGCSISSAAAPRAVLPSSTSAIAWREIDASRRPRDGAPRRRRGRHDLSATSSRREHRQDDGRARPRRLLQEGAAHRAARRQSLLRRRRHRATAGGSRLLASTCARGEIARHRRPGRRRAAPRWRG